MIMPMITIGKRLLTYVSSFFSSCSFSLISPQPGQLSANTKEQLKIAGKVRRTLKSCRRQPLLNFVNNGRMKFSKQKKPGFLNRMRWMSWQLEFQKLRHWPKKDWSCSQLMSAESAAKLPGSWPALSSKNKSEPLFHFLVFFY